MPKRKIIKNLWFGQCCSHFVGMWEDTDIQNYRNNEPILVFCNNFKNLNKHEGNCNKTDCPIL